MIKVPQFTEFRFAGARMGSDFVGVTKSGSISVYSGFYRKNNIQSFTHCILLVDKAQNLIGMQFGLNALGDGAYNLNHDKGHKTAWVSAGNFFKLNGLSLPDWFGKYKPEKVDMENRPNTYMLDLDKKIPVIRKPRKDMAVSQ